jgi:predicted small lipoprotein YifL
MKSNDCFSRRAWRQSRLVALLMLLLVTTIALNGCGNKGDLVLPDKPAEPAK